MIQPNSGLLKMEKDGPVRLKCTLSLKQLFASDDSEREKFKDKLNVFLKAPRCCPEIFQLKCDDLIYFSEQLLPNQKDRRKRKPLLLVLGNPASHSVREGMFFSYEGKEEKKREHRFWKLLSSAGILNFNFDPALDLDKELSIEERNRKIEKRSLKRKEMLLSSDYVSRYQIGLAVFISFPSPASGPTPAMKLRGMKMVDWSGVKGVQDLFGEKSKAMKQIIAAEKERIKECAEEFLSPKGTVISFNKLSWDELRSSDDPPYTLPQAMQGELRGHLEGIKSIELFGAPPTRRADLAKLFFQHFAESHVDPRS